MNNSPTSNSDTLPRRKKGILFVLSAPSGAGKNTIIQGLSACLDRCAYSISCTTRAPREGEQHGRDYFFLDEAEFRRRIDVGEFLEYAEVHGKFYGTLKETIAAHLRAGRDVLMDIDVAGAEQVRTCSDTFFTDALADVFIMPLSLDQLRQRLESRGTETAEQIALRLRNADAEMRHWHKYRYTMVTTTREADLANMLAIVHAEHCLSRHQTFNV